MKLKKKNCLIALIILLLLVFELVNPFKLASSYAIKELNYSNEASNKILDLGLKDKVLEHEYSKFIDINILSSDFIIENYDIYKELTYYPHHNNLDLVNKLIDKGYDTSSINCIMNTGDTSSINSLLEQEINENIVDFLNISYAKLSNLDRYIAYQKENLSDYDETVLAVELGLDSEPYTNYKEINEFSFSMLVNKYNKLNENFVPDDLVKINSNYSVSDDNYGNKVMLESFYKMADALSLETNLKVYIRSCYRPFTSQQEVYDEYLALYGQNYVKKYVAYPGFSEHQTGLAIDIKASSSNNFSGTEEEKWLKNNAHKYGFILRYTKKLEEVTGYQSEPWHYRYVGEEIASYIYEKGISFDEYYISFLG